MKDVVILQDSSTRRIYYVFPKSQHTAAEAALRAARMAHKKVEDMVVKSAIENEDSFEVMTSRGDFWCCTRKEGK